MAVDALVRCRVSSETKALLQSIAAREQITESALVRQLLETLVRTSATESPVSCKSDVTELRAERLSIRLSPDDRLLLFDRASARGMPSATYVAVLVRSHLRKLTPLPTEELAALKRSIAELGAIGRNLNQIARTLNAGGRLEGSGRHLFEAMLKIAEGLRDHVRALLKGNETSWERGYGETNH
jgi:Bacterial mobilisation protein (MobC)